MRKPHLELLCVKIKRKTEYIKVRSVCIACTGGGGVWNEKNYMFALSEWEKAQLFECDSFVFCFLALNLHLSMELIRYNNGWL